MQRRRAVRYVHVQTSVSRCSNTSRQWEPELSWGSLYGPTGFARRGQSYLYLGGLASRKKAKVRVPTFQRPGGCRDGAVAGGHPALCLPGVGHGNAESAMQPRPCSRPTACVSPDV